MEVAPLPQDESARLKALYEALRDLTCCTHAILPRTILEAPDTLADARCATNPSVTGDLFIRLYAETPLNIPEGHALRTFCVIDRRPRQFTDKQRQALTDLGGRP